MRRLFIIAAAGTLFLFSCNKNDIHDNPSQVVKAVFSLSFSDNVSIGETPIDNTRADETQSRDLIGVQILQNGEKYAYGLFDNTSDMTLYLHSGNTYKAICSVVKDGKDKLKYFGSEYHPNNLSGYEIFAYGDYGSAGMRNTNGSGILCYITVANKNYYEGGRKYYYSGYGFPFAYYSTSDNLYEAHPDQYSAFPMMVNNSFIYSETEGFECLSKGFNITNDNYLASYPSIKRYYGESVFSASGNDTNVTINMKSLFFLFKCKVSGVSDGHASLTISNNDKVFIDQDIVDSYESDISYYCFNNVEDYLKYDNYTENLTVSMRWMRGIGIEQDLGSQVIQIKGNTLNKINIDLSTN
jgi:hypothetical protein